VPVLFFAGPVKRARLSMVSPHSGTTRPQARAPYIGRFAPSPTGPLHLGSLLTALASFLDAKSHNGLWLVRMEDLDPPREAEGAANGILETLQHYGLQWDGDVWFQSQRHPIYQNAVDQLLKAQKAYFCRCSRTQIQAASGGSRYPGICRGTLKPPDTPCAVRLEVEDTPVQFDDILQGPQQCNLHQNQGDFVIKRKDGLFAYHLAVALDDAAQGISHIVRGSDLLESSFCHIHLQHTLGLPTPLYAHLPVIVNEQGQKLSKQTYAEPIARSNPVPLLHQCLTLLGQQPPAALKTQNKESILQWGIEHWQLHNVPHTRALHPGTS